MSSRRLSALLLVLTVASGGCTTLDRAIGMVPWFTTMRDQPAVRPFEGPLDSTGKAPKFLPPEGSVPITGREDSNSIYDPAGLRITDAMHNPMAKNAASLERGGKIYNTYCIVCHGVQGHGDGTVAGRIGYVPDLTLDITKQRSDGYIYAIIRHGRGVMPRYGDKIRDPGDRWNVVNYVRKLEGQTTP
ncbi:MAG TPA: cytochrome c [Gemmatimonadales bacterium]|jgi:cytochrome c5